MTEKEKHYAVLTALALTTLPFLFIVKHPASWSLAADNTQALSLYLSSVLGYIGVAMLVWQLVLGTRAIAGLFFDDLASKLSLHRTVGTYGVAFVFLHPFLAMYAYGQTWLYTITPNLSTPYETAVTYGRFAFVLLLLVWVTSALIRSKISYRPWKYIHYASYPLLFFSLLHVPPVGSSFNTDLIQLFWYSFVVISIVSVLLRMRHIFGFGKVVYIVTERNDLTPEAFLLRLRYDQKNLHVRTGQYVYLQPKLYSEEHPFTVLDHDEESGELLVAIKKFGKFTQKLASIPIGSPIYVDGPYGVFTAEKTQDPDMPSIYIAGGIGITPFLKHALNGKNYHQFLFYANQSRESAVLREQLKKQLGKQQIDVFSRENPGTIAEQNVEYGYLSENIVKKYVADPTAYEYYICGPEGMLEATKSMLVNLHVPKNQIHLEEFSF